MCYAKDYNLFDDEKKAEDTQVVKERRASLIDRLLNVTNKHGEIHSSQRSRTGEIAGRRICEVSGDRCGDTVTLQKAAMQGTPTSRKMGNRPELVDS